MAPPLVVAAVVTAVGAAYAGYQSYQVGKFNEELAETEAQYQQNKAKLDESRHRDNVKRIIGQQRVAFAKSGVSLLSDSVQDVQTDTLSEAELDARIIRAGGEINAYRSKMEGVNARRQGNAGLVSGLSKAGSTLLTATAEV